MTSSSTLHASADEKRGLQRPKRATSALKADTSSATSPPPGKIPLSACAPLQLPRALEVFGKHFEVHISSALTLSVDTVMQAVAGISVQTFFRTAQPVMYQNLKKLLYAGRGLHQPSRGTKKNILQDFGSFFAPEALSAVLDGKEPPPSPEQSDWQTVRQVMHGCEGEPLHDIASHMATFDDQMQAIRSLALSGQQVEARLQLQSLLGGAEAAWQELDAQLVHQVLPLVETALQTLAWLECRLLPGTPPQDSGLTGLLDADRRPFGHWLREVMQVANCDSLAGLETRLAGVTPKYHGRDIGLDLLKRWSASKVVAMPHAAVKPVLRAVRVRQRAKRLEDRYYVARVLTFLCDLTRAATLGKAPTWPAVQAQIRSRYIQLYRLQVAQRLSAASASAGKA